MDFGDFLLEQRWMAGISEEEDTAETYQKKVAESAKNIESALTSLFRGFYFRVFRALGVAVEFGRMSQDDYAKEQLRTNYGASPNHFVRLSIVPSMSTPGVWDDLTVRQDSSTKEKGVPQFRRQSKLTPEKAEAAVIKWFKKSAKLLKADEPEPKTPDKPRDVTPEDPVFGKVISSYSRKQALSDGVLIDVSKDAKEAGFKWPVAITQGVKGKLTPKSKGTGQSFEGRLWDLLWMMKHAVKRGGTEIKFMVKMGKRNEQFVAVSGPGDDGEPVITVMLPGED